MSRDAVARRVLLEAEASPDAVLAFVTIDHPDLADPIRAVSDVMAYVVDGARYEGMPFRFRLLNDDESGPRTQITIQNVDRRIGSAVRRSTQRAKVRLEVRSSADFDLSVDPRVPLGSAAPLYGFSQFELVNVEADVLQLTGDVALPDFSVEPWPNIRATQDRLPGLFR